MRVAPRRLPCWKDCRSTGATPSCSRPTTSAAPGKQLHDAVQRVHQGGCRQAGHQHHPVRTRSSDGNPQPPCKTRMRPRWPTINAGCPAARPADRWPPCLRCAAVMARWRTAVGRSRCVPADCGEPRAARCVQPYARVLDRPTDRVSSAALPAAAGSRGPARARHARSRRSDPRRCRIADRRPRLVLGQRWGLGRLGYLAALLVAADPILLNQSGEVMTETLATLLCVLGLLALTQWSRRQTYVAAASRGSRIGLGRALSPHVPDLGRLVRHLHDRREAQLEECSARLRVRRRAGRCVVALGHSQPVGFGRPIVTTTHGGYTLLLANNPLLLRIPAHGDLGQCVGCA